MKRSEINQAHRDATACFAAHGWALPPRPRWDITDFGSGDFPEWDQIRALLGTDPH